MGTACYLIQSSKECPVSARIKFVMDLFDDFCMKKYMDLEDDLSPNLLDFVQVFNGSLHGYSAVGLLNDYEHLKKYHFDCKGFDKTCKHESNQLDVCCNAILRKERHKNNEHDTVSEHPFGQYFHSLDDPSKNILDIAVKVHQFINH